MNAILGSQLATPNPKLDRMIRIAHILDPELKAKIVQALADRRGMSPAAIPEWFELDEADFVDLLNDLQADEQGRPEEGD